ncbi:hypothetical protein [Variovorax paradoxus]|uniref:hypothetical protein n=1 Tax=Variovorax paradoxus TaxID=34073 RepID=UPI001ABC5021
MNKIFSARTAVLLSLGIAFGTAVAAPPTIYLSCTVNGVGVFEEEVEKISETVEVEVEEKPWLTIVLRGEQLGQYLSAEDIEDGDIRSTAISNRSNGDEWNLTVRTVNAGQRNYVASVRINRINGSFTYSRKGTTKSGMSFDDNVVGTCTKRSRTRKF